MLEDSHHQVVINGVDFDLILRTNDEQTAHTSWDLFDYAKQEHKHTSYDMDLAYVLLQSEPSFEGADRV